MVNDLDSVPCVWLGFRAGRAAPGTVKQHAKVNNWPAEYMADQAVFVCLFFYFT